MGYKADSDGIQTDSHTTQVAECSNKQNATDKRDTKKLHAHTTQVAECGKLQNTTDIYTLGSLILIAARSDSTVKRSGDARQIRIVYQKQSQTTFVAECSNKQNITNICTIKEHGHPTHVAECSKQENTTDIYTLASLILIAASFDSAVKRSGDARQIRKGHKQTQIQHLLPNAATNRTSRTFTQSKNTDTQHTLPNAASYRTPRTFTHWQA